MPLDHHRRFLPVLAMLMSKINKLSISDIAKKNSIQAEVKNEQKHKHIHICRPLIEINPIILTRVLLFNIITTYLVIMNDRGAAMNGKETFLINHGLSFTIGLLCYAYLGRIIIHEIQNSGLDLWETVVLMVLYNLREYMKLSLITREKRYPLACRDYDTTRSVTACRGQNQDRRSPRV